MEKYIQQLITDNTRVIIPDFGAFIRPQGEGEVMFNQFLSFDDGMLVEAVKSAENISDDEAKSRIAAYVETVKNKLNAGESISIEGVGVFRMDDNHIVMDNSERKSPIIDIQTTKAEEAPAAAPAPKAEPTVVVNNYSEKKNYLWLYIIGIVLLFLLGVYVCLFVVNKENAVYEYFYGVEQVEDEVEVPEVAPEPEPEPEPEPAPVPTAEKRYNIIVGSYNDMASANARVEYLKGKGFNEAFTITRNINGRTKYMAVIESHDKLPTAERRQEEIVDTYRIESWITNAGE